MKVEIYSKITTYNLLINIKVSSSPIDLGDIYRLVKSVDNIFSIDKISLSSVSKYNIWLSWFSIVYNIDIMHGKLYVDKTDIVAKINEKLSIETYNSSISMYDLLFNVYTNVSPDVYY